MEEINAEQKTSDGFVETKPKERYIVNPIALQNSFVRLGDRRARVMDLSFMRVVIEEDKPWPLFAENESIVLDFLLDRHLFSAAVIQKSRGQGWLRFVFEKIVPSAQAHLRSFLSPKKIGESIVEDWRTKDMRHYHGLNECELWFDEKGSVFFTYLETTDPKQQFMIRLKDSTSPLQVGKILRQNYIEMKSLDAELPLIPLSDREVYTKLGDCRDIITNFRPTGQSEYNLKQRLLKVISETLYSTGNRVDFAPVRPPKIVTLPVEG